jgi:hypothetical protein
MKMVPLQLKPRHVLLSFVGLFMCKLLTCWANTIFRSQMGKDVVSFLSWAAEPEMEERKLVTTIPLASLNVNTQL